MQLYGPLMSSSELAGTLRTSVAGLRTLVRGASPGGVALRRARCQIGKRVLWRTEQVAAAIDGISGPTSLGVR
jgi:hypothetical protein